MGPTQAPAAAPVPHACLRNNQGCSEVSVLAGTALFQNYAWRKDAGLACDSAGALRAGAFDSDVMAS